MPLILTSNEATASGHIYEDITGVSYEYPARYRNVITEGERFIYYRGRQLPSGGRQPQVYFGSGVIGPVRPSQNQPDYFVCEVLDYYAFNTPLYFKDPNGAYLESGGARLGYFQPGVRRISEAEYIGILGAASALSRDPDDVKPSSGGGQGAYASPNVARDVDVYAMQVVVEHLRGQFPGRPIETQLHNNPGFDIRVGTATDVICYVEVKGTQAPHPRFYLSEGERLFSEQHADMYMLVVVYAVDIARRDHKLFVHRGFISSERFELQPVQWACASLRTP